MTRANWTSATAWPDRPPPFHPWKLFCKAYPAKSLSLPLYPTIFSLYPSGLSHSLSASLSSVADITPPAAVAGRGNGIALSALLDARRIWKGQSAVPAGASLPTGHARLDALLPGGGWPEHALSEILHARDGVGELQLLMPTLARLTQAQRRVVLVGAPYVPYPQAWLAAAVDLRHLVLLQASGRDALWAAEQCLRSGSCAAVLCWPQQADDRALRRLQVAAESGQALGFAYRPLREAVNPSPAALRLCIETRPPRLRILKCRGGLAPATALPASAWQ